MTVSRIRALAQRILDATVEIDDKLEQDGLPTPSFDPTFSQDVLERSEIFQARQDLLEATDELHYLFLGPIGQLTKHSPEANLTLQAIYRFNLAFHVPLPASASATAAADLPTATFAEIAEKAGVSESILKRLLRHAMTYRIFCEPVEGKVAHTAASKVLATEDGIREWVGMVGEDMWGAAAKTVDAISKWPSSHEPNHSGFNLFHSTPLTVFEFLAANPSVSARYSKAINWFSSMPYLSPQYIATSFPWSSLPSGSTVVDLGGGHGATSIALATAFPELKLVIQDLPDVVSRGREILPKHLAGRVQFQTHDIFTPQPSRLALPGQDSVAVAVFILRWILHDWSDTYAIRILQSLVPALSLGARLCIVELVLPPGGTENGVSPYQQREMRGEDLAMLGFHNSKERDRSEFEALFRAVDERLQINEIRRAEGAFLSCIEVVWRE